MRGGNSVVPHTRISRIGDVFFPGISTLSILRILLLPTSICCVNMEHGYCTSIERLEDSVRRLSRRPTRTFGAFIIQMVEVT